MNRYVATFLAGLMGLLLAASNVGGLFLRPAQAVPLGTLPGDTQKTVGLILMGFSPYVRQLSANAIQALPLDRAQTMVHNLRGLRSYSDDQIVQLAQQYDFAIRFVLSTLSPIDHQRFINGVWGVSSGDEQFAQLAEQRANEMFRGPAPIAPLDPPGGIVQGHPTPSERGLWCALGGGHINNAGYCESN